MAIQLEIAIDITITIFTFEVQRIVRLDC